MPQIATHSPNDDELGGLSPVQLKALASLIRGATVTDAAAEADIDRTTLHRWLRDDAEFIAAYNAARAELQRSTRAALADLGHEAVGVMRDMLHSADVPAPVKLRAAAMVLGMIGADEPEPIGSDDAASIRRDQERALMSPLEQILDQLG